MDADLVSENVEEGADDFIEPWLSLSNELNFRTFAGTMFTMFEISILGNWSCIMNSARLKERYTPVIFFFSFRLMMILCIYPLLNSFIIAAYITRKDLQEKQHKEDMENRLAEEKKFNEDLERMIALSEGGIELENLNGDSGNEVTNKLGAMHYIFWLKFFLFCNRQMSLLFFFQRLILRM